MNAVVLGDGAWGTALAMVLTGNGHPTALWGPFPDYIAQMARQRENTRFLPGPRLPDALELEPDLGLVLREAELVVLASPVQYMRSILEQVRDRGLPPGCVVTDVAKGIEVGTVKRPSQIASELLGDVPYGALSGPSHAEEVARGIPTAVVAAAREPAVSAAIQAAFISQNFRVYTSGDLTGVELGGALKNIFALAAGICDGMGFGDNSKAALMTRGIVEMARLGRALGGDPDTFSGLSGVGDLIVTCISRHSRNRHVGEELGRGRSLTEIQSDMGMVVAEGVKTVVSARELARAHGVETPIIDEVYAALYENKDPCQAARDLMTREAKQERLESEA